MATTTGPMRALPELVPTFTPRETAGPRVPDGTHPYDESARNVAIAAALTGHRMASGEVLPQLDRRVSSRPDVPAAKVPDWNFLVRLRGAIVAWHPDDRPMAPPQDGEDIYGQVLADRTGPRPVLGGPEPDPEPAGWREWLADMAYGAAKWIEPVGADVCAWCQASIAGWCDACADAIEAAAALDQLHDEIIAAPDMATALRLMAVSAEWRTSNGHDDEVTAAITGGTDGGQQ